MKDSNANVKKNEGWNKNKNGKNTRGNLITDNKKLSGSVAIGWIALVINFFIAWAD